MKVAIHHRENSYSEHWIDYCKENNISYKIVNCYDSNIIDQVADCDFFMWHWPFWHSRDILFAKQLIYCLETKGIKTFPSLKTCLLYDDKVGQKYLFEALNISHPESYIFYNKRDAIAWSKKISYPIIFKLRCGAGSQNVKLLKNKRQIRREIIKSFTTGHSAVNRVSRFLDRFWQFKRDKNLKSFFRIFTGLYRVFFAIEHDRFRQKEKGYIYLQKFIPNLTDDIRVVIIGDKAFTIKRVIRDNDFRASGSGILQYEHESIDIKLIETSFSIYEKLKMQCVAFDFVNDQDQWSLLEISYSFVLDAYLKCPGYWNRSLNWHNESFNPAKLMIADLLKL